MNSSCGRSEQLRGPEVVATELVVAYEGGKGPALGLRGLTARFVPGITGLVGPNGAGKSTFLRTVCGLLPPSGGALTLGGREPSAFIAAHGTGFLPENPPLPPYLTVREFLSGVLPGGAPLPGEGDDLLGLPGLGSLLPRRIGVLSHGQRKKVALGAALSGEPWLLLLDEPTNGLDPGAVRELREVLTGLGREGRTVIVSSHHLDELQRMADALVFVRDGQALGAWTRREALEEHGSFDALYEKAFLGRPG